MQWVLPALIIGAALVAVALLLGPFLVGRRSNGAENAALALLQNQVSASVQQTGQQVDNLRAALSASIQTLSRQITQSLTESNQSMGLRLDNANRVVGDVRQQLGQLEASSRRMIDIGKDISKLENILKPPKLRGSLGELFLGELLAQILPPAHYRLQHPFKGGETVDAVVILHSGIVPIDAKFPLENFQRIFSADSEEERKAARKSFVRDVKAHIDTIAAKYIRTDEGTFDFALMYVPAENVYYETIIKDEYAGGAVSLFLYALNKRVIPVSPNSFYAYLQTILLGLKGLQVEEGSRDILRGLSRLRKEFDLFSETFRLVGQHLENSVKKYADAQKRFGQMESKMEQIDGLAKGLDTEASPSLPEGT